MKKKKVKEPVYIPLLYTEEPFEIYQLTEKFKFNARKNEFHGINVASPAYGSQVDDKPIYPDNAGKIGFKPAQSGDIVKAICIVSNQNDPEGLLHFELKY